MEKNNKKRLFSITHMRKYFPLKKSSFFQKEQLYVRANDDVTIDIFEGETFGLVGESGCGKSTLGRVLLQLYPRTAGSIMYYGTQLDKVAPDYVKYTLTHAKKMIKNYNDAQAKVDALYEKYKGRDDLTYTESSERDEAVFKMHNELDKVAKILGGFMVCPDVEEQAKILLSLNDVRADILKCQEKIQDLFIERDKVEARLLKANADADIENDKAISKIDRTVKELTARIEDDAKRRDAIIKTLDKEVEKNKHLPEFEKYEAMRDDGVDLARLRYNEIRKLRKDIQIIFQDPYSSLNPRMTVGQIVEEGVVTHKMYRQGSSKLQEYVLKTMEDCGLADYMLYRFPHQFSGGQRQRICIARALAVKPKFVVCDECVSALDVSIQSQILNLLQDLKEQNNLTYLFISHDLSVVKYISDRIGVMYLGNLVEIADTKTLFEDPRHPYTVALLSSIPTTDPKDLKKEKIILKGTIPSPIKPPSGCKFHTRCYMATEKCKCETPKLVEVTPGHFCACHYLEKKSILNISKDKGNLNEAKK